MINPGRPWRLLALRKEVNAIPNGMLVVQVIHMWSQAFGELTLQSTHEETHVLLFLVRQSIQVGLQLPPEALGD
jgi:hypothetical protein